MVRSAHLQLIGKDPRIVWLPDSSLSQNWTWPNRKFYQACQIQNCVLYKADRKARCYQERPAKKQKSIFTGRKLTIDQ